MKNFWENKKVLVTGAAGFIGSHAVETLVQKGAHVRAVVSRRTTKNRLQEMLGEVMQQIDIVYADLLNLEECLTVTQNQDIILNFAGMDGGASFKRQYSARIFSTNTRIALNILDAAVENKIDRLLLMSSVEVYPKSATSPISEEYALTKDFMHEGNGYVWSKRFIELAAKMYAHEYNLKIAIARMGNVFGPRDYAQTERERVIPAFISKVLQDKPIVLLGNGLAKRSFLYVTDAVNALLSLVEVYAAYDPVNIVGSHYITIKSLANEIGRLAKRKIGITIGSDNVITQNSIISSKKSKRYIGSYETTSLQQGLLEILKTFK